MYNLTIAYISNNIAPFRINLLDSLAQKTKKVTLFYFNEIDDGVNPSYVNKRPKYANYKNISTYSLYQQIKEIYSNDIIIFDGYTGINKIKIMVIMILLRRRYFISIDGIIKNNRPNKLKYILKKLLIKNAFSIFSTNQVTDTILKQYSKRIRIIRHIFTTLNRNDFLFIGKLNKQELREKWNVDRKDKVILFIGKFIKSKGVYEFIDAGQENYKYILIGGNKNQIHNVKLNSNYRIIEFLEKKEILELISLSDVFVLPTYTDVWGLVIVEAISCGVPVVTTVECNAGNELITNGINGFLINKQSVNELKFSIDQALDLDPLKVKEYDKKLMNHYTIDDSSENMLNILTKI